MLWGSYLISIQIGAAMVADKNAVFIIRLGQAPILNTA